jgi:hypothetical protein
MFLFSTCLHEWSRDSYRRLFYRFHCNIAGVVLGIVLLLHADWFFLLWVGPMQVYLAKIKIKNTVVIMMIPVYKHPHHMICLFSLVRLTSCFEDVNPSDSSDTCFIWYYCSLRYRRRFVFFVGTSIPLKELRWTLKEKGKINTVP